MESVHKGHRERLRRRFVEYGLDNLSDIEAIELLLFYALPRRNTNDLAHILLQNFGSFRGVMEAQMEDLKQVDGIGDNAAQLIRLTAELGRRYLLRGRRARGVIRSADDAGEYILPLFTYETRELLYVLCLNSGGKVVRCERVGYGTGSRVDFSAREVVNIVLRTNAEHVIVTHNHPSGNAAPSQTDISATRRLKTALNMVGVELDDHIIVSGSDFTSLKEGGYF